MPQAGDAQMDLGATQAVRDGECATDGALGGDALDICRKLRTKFSFLPLVNADNEPLLWQQGDGSTAVYWGLRTMACAGPDGGLAHASTCRSDRGCYARYEGRS